MTPEKYARLRAGYVRAGHGTPAPGATPLPPDEEDDPPGGAPRSPGHEQQ